MEKMKNILTITVFTLIIFLCGCSDDDNNDTSDTILVYESQNKIQCGSNGLTLDESLEKLTNEGIDVIESSCGNTTGMVYAAVCGGGTGAILLHKVHISNLPGTEKIGFNDVSTLIDAERDVGYKITGCSAIERREIKAQNCSSEWYALIEKKISTGDDLGHGPDVGSIEWRSVIEFKLGIRGDNKAPPLDSEQWCNYINENFIEKPA